MSGGIWTARHRTATGVVLTSILGDAFPDRTLVDLPGAPTRPTGWVAQAHQPGPGASPSRVEVAREMAPKAPLLWFVLVEQVVDGVPLADLVAFSTPDHRAGAVVGVPAFRTMRISWGNQVGAFQWETATGRTRQVYVAPARRRHGVGTTLAVVASVVQVACGRPWVHGDGRRTDLGEAWLRDKPASWQSRIAVRTEVVRPMTPAADAGGVLAVTPAG